MKLFLISDGSYVVNQEIKYLNSFDVTDALIVSAADVTDPAVRTAAEWYAKFQNMELDECVVQPIGDAVVLP